MNIYDILKKCRVFALFVAFVFIFTAPSAVFARAGCFLGGTNILTPSGEVPVSRLKSGDAVISYNTETGRKEESRIQNVSVYQEASYYLINGKTGVTGTHPFYVDRDGQMHIVEVKDLKVGDLLFSENGGTSLVNSLELLHTPATVYNLEDVSPNNNYFADNILVHNKGGGGCFLADTKIETPDGLKQVSSFKAGDRLTSWDGKDGSRKVSVVGRVDVFEADDYYVINNKIEVTGTHPFYVASPQGIVLKEVAELKQGDLLINGEKDLTVDSIDHVFEKAVVYNLVDVSPFNNYFADGVLVHNKGGSGGHGHSSSTPPFVYAGKSYSDYWSCSSITDPTGKKACEGHFFWSTIMFFIFMAFFIVMIAVAAVKNKKDAAAFKGKKFTEDPELIQYVKKIVPNFTNTYDSFYSSDTENWAPMKSPPEVSPALYQNLATVDVLRAKFQELYEKYEYDWTIKNFEGMKAYMKEPYFSKQKQIFDSSFGSNFDVTYKPVILSATPLSVDLKIDGQIVKFQVNGEMVDFEVSSSGSVLSGVPTAREFTEYWHVFIDLDKNYFLLDLEN